jgi:NitT/TauT family transport system permease protein
VPSYLLPTPLEVVKVAWLRLPDLWASLLISAEAATGGLLASIVVGGLIALIFARSQWARKMFFPYTILLQTVLILAVAPLIII